MNEFRLIEYEVWFDPQHHVFESIMPMFPEGDRDVFDSFPELTENILVAILHKLKDL